MENQVTWWEKTVEYTFLLQFSPNTGRQVWPLGGKAELMGDTIYSLDKVRWGLFEFKRDKASLKTEIAKFAVDTQEYAQARLDVRELNKKLKKIRAAHSAHHVATSSNADVQDVKEPECLAEKPVIEACEAANLKLDSIQYEAFVRAQEFFKKQFSEPTYHFLVYGQKAKDKPAIALYSRRYFDLLKEPCPADAEVADAMGELVKWDKTSFAAYLREFMNFKRFGVPATVQGGTSRGGDRDGNVGETVRASGEKATDSGEASGGANATKEWQVGDIKVGDYPTYIIGVDTEKIIVAPLDESEGTLRLLNYISNVQPTPTTPVTPLQQGTRHKGSSI